MPASDPINPADANAARVPVVSSRLSPIWEATSPAWLNAIAHVGDGPLGFAGAGGDQVGDVWDVFALQFELGHRRRRQLGRLSDLYLPSGGQVEGTLECAADDVRGFDAGLGEGFHAAGGFGGAELGVRRGLDGGVAELFRVRLRLAPVEAATASIATSNSANVFTA